MGSRLKQEPIAVIGMAFKFPGGADSPDNLWNVLANKKCVATKFPNDRFNIDAFSETSRKKDNTIKTDEAHFLEGDIRHFDAGFFSTAPHEAAAMDPQQRGLMETTYHAFENAGLGIQDVSGSRASVHVGCFTSDFANMQFLDIQAIPKYNALGSAGSILANRISWFYDLRGESMYVDTACSSSLVAMALACQGLTAGDADMAIVGASNVILGPEFNVSLSNMNFLSPRGRCHSFDSNADGYGRGEGFAALILKPMSKALADGNPIRAVVRSIGMNQDGHTHGGITQPSKDMQVQLIRDTYHKAGLDMSETRFFEAHGTGTKIGDPIEARAIGEAFFKYRSKEDPIYVGAIKSNLGHLEGTSGLAGVVKTILALEKGIIPPNTNFTTLNPDIDAEFFNLKFPNECIPWPSGGVRRASVNSFGFGGSNAHVVLEAASTYLQSIGRRQDIVTLTTIQKPLHLNGVGPHDHSGVTLVNGTATNGHKTTEKSETNGDEELILKKPYRGGIHGAYPVSRDAKLLIISASDEEGIERQTRALAAIPDTCANTDDENILGDVISTLNKQRATMEWKSFCLLETIHDFKDLGKIVSKPARKGSSGTPKLGMVFTGQGAQWPRMGHELLTWTTFRSSISQTQKYLDELGCSWNVVDEIAMQGKASRIHNPEFSQAITTAIQIGLVDLTKALGVTPLVVVGHSSGEIAAAYCAGLLSHESAIRVSYFRGLLASKLSADSSFNYSMASIGLASEKVRSELKKLETQDPRMFNADQITISCINSPTNTTVSGPVQYLEVLVNHLTAKNVFARKLKVGVGYHSPQMERVSSQYLEQLSNLQPALHPSNVRMVSSVMPGLVDTNTVCSGSYWVRNMVSPVRFVEAMNICCANSGDVEATKRLDRRHLEQISTDGWLEIGPHAALKGPLREIFESQKRSNIIYTSLLLRNEPANLSTLKAAGELICAGFEVSLDRITHLNTEPTRKPRTIVNLPQYPFNHSIIHWEESNRSKTYKSRSYGDHPLLGSPAMDWNSLDARWRFFIKKSQIPWVADHRLHDDLWYPASGMIVMAMEALKQLIPTSLWNFELQNVSFTAPIIVRDVPEGTETQISMAPTSQEKSKGNEHKFKIFLRKLDDTWEQVCDGTISASSAKAPSSILNQREQDYRTHQAQLAYHKAVSSCQGSLESTEMYRKISEDTGLRYGPTFQSLSRIHYDAGGKAHAKIVPVADDVVANSKPFTIHPSTLDGVFQLGIPALSEGLKRGLPTLVPARLTRLWISHHGVGLDPKESEVAHASAKFTSKRNAETSFTVLAESDMQIRLEVEELEVTAVASEQDAAASESSEKNLGYELHWKLDPTLLSTAEISDYCLRHRDTDPEPESWYEDLRYALLSFAKEALSELQRYNRTEAPSMSKYRAWLQARVDEYEVRRASNGAQPLSSGPELQKFAASLASSNRRGALNMQVAAHLQDILTARIDPLDLLFTDPECLPSFYEEVNTSAKAFAALYQYLDTLVHKDPSARFLEVGAGTGATTSIILNAIGHPEIGTRYSEYMLSDISGSFIPSAKERFKAFDHVQYRVLNIEKDIAAQGFEQGKYDVVIAANVLHATENLNRTLSGVRQLLKPGGKLVLVEMVTPNNIETGFIFGTLPGWWLGSESFRQASPVIDEEQWNHILQQAQFSGTDHIFRDWDSEVCHGWSVMVSSAAENTDQNNPKVNGFGQRKVSLVIDESSTVQVEVANHLQSILELAGDSSVRLTLNQLFESTDLGSQDCILLADMEQFNLHEANAVHFQVYQKILTSAKSIIWVHTKGSTASCPPYWAMVEGLCRVCRSEDNSRRISTLILESNVTQSGTRTAAKIAKVFKHTTGECDADSYEPEYQEFDGYLSVNRLIPAKYLNNHIQTRTQKPVRMRSFGAGVPLSLEIRTPGLLDTIEWAEDTVAYSPLGPDQVEIRVQAIGVNFKECLTLLGRVNTDRLGSECSGFIVRVGAAVKHLETGDRVVLGSLETYKTLVRAESFQVVKIPQAMSFTEAAAIPTAFCTAYHSLYRVARLQKGESVLIHAAAGGTGQAALQIAQHIGAVIFATVGSVEKRKLLVEHYGISEDHIFNSRDASFAEGIKRVTNGRGVDVVLNSLSGKLLVASWEIIAEFGRFVEIGRKDIDTRGYLPMFPFIKNAMFAGVDLAAIVDGGGTSGRYVLQEVFDLMETGALRPLYPITPFPVDQTEQAFRLLQSGRSMGKIVLELHDSSLVPFREGSDSQYRLSRNATYVVSGGLGGIGRQIVRWLVRRGAQHLLLLTRSGISGSPAKAKMIAELESQQIQVQCQVCDIGDFESLTKTVEEASKTMPPFRGCFQAAMVIQDRPFANMSYAEWHDAIRPKIQGSWNLHKALPSGMDFFVMLSSSVGVFGNAGQSNYAAGNTFQDALARCRVEQGEKAAAIDLGMILGEGFVAERADIRDKLMRLNLLLPLTLPELFAVFDYYCDPDTALTCPEKSQIVTGIEAPAIIRQSGREVPEPLFRTLFRALHQMTPVGAVSTTGTAKVQDVAAVIQELPTLEAAGAFIAGALRDKLCAILGLDANEKTINDRMESFGVDSLIALEVRNWIAREMRAELAVYEILGDVKLIDTGLAAASKTGFRQPHWTKGGS